MALKIYKIKLRYIALAPQHTETKQRLVALKITLGYMQAKHQRCGKHKWEKLQIPSDQYIKEKLGKKSECGNKTDHILFCKEEDLQEQTEAWQNNFIKREMNLLGEQDLLVRGKKTHHLCAGYFLLPLKLNQNCIMFVTD